MSGVSAWRTTSRNAPAMSPGPIVDDVVLGARAPRPPPPGGRARRSAASSNATEKVRSSMVGRLAGQRRDEARVQPAREVGTDRHVGAQPQPHAVAHESRRGRRRGRADRRNPGATRSARRRSARAPRRAGSPGGADARRGMAMRGARGPHSVNTSSMPARSGSAPTSPEANSAFASEPKTSVPSASSVA